MLTLILTMQGKISVAQPFSLDTTFQPNYVFRDFYFENDAGYIACVYEMEDGSLRLSGSFQDPFDNTMIGELIKLDANGQFDPNFGSEGVSTSGVGIFFEKPYIYKVPGLSTFYRVNYETSERDTLWDFNRTATYWNYALITNAYIIGDGDLFVSGAITYHKDFPDERNSYFAKIKKDGIYDTTFNHNTNFPVKQFFRYDSTRIILTGNFSAYDGVPMNRIARIYNDGTLDTTFHSIFTYYHTGLIVRVLALDDGKMLVCGAFNILNFFDKQEYKKQLALVRLLPNGDLDPTFNNFNNAQSKNGILTGDSAIYDLTYNVLDVLKTENNKLLIGGRFWNYQGYYRGSIALTDMNGYLDTTVFTGAGMDSCLGMINYYFDHGIYRMIPAQNDKYYVAGQFSRFNGHWVEPIIRLNPYDHVGVEEVEKEELLQLYPNPAKDFINLKIPKGSHTLKIYNSMGVFTLRKEIEPMDNSLVLDTSFLEPGLYICKIELGNSQFVSRKFIIQK